MSFPASDSIRGVSFDLGGTLIRAHPSVGSVYASVCADHGIVLDPAACDRAFEEAWARISARSDPERERFASADGGEEGWWRRVVHEVLEACGVSGEAPPVDTFREAFASPRAWAVFDDVRGTLQALRSEGYRLAILSNWDSRLPRLLETLELSPFFDAVLGSALAGMEKPNRKFFALAASAVDLPPSSILHVGDLVREDYLGARNAGFKALLIDRLEGSSPDPAVDEAHIVRSIAEVRARVNGGKTGVAAPGSRP